MSTSTLLYLGAGAAVLFLLYKYSQNNAAAVPTASGAALQPYTDPGGTSIINQAQQLYQTGSALYSQGSSLLDSAGSAFGGSDSDDD